MANFKRCRPRTFKTHTLKILRPKNGADRIPINDRRRMDAVDQLDEIHGGAVANLGK